MVRNMAKATNAATAAVAQSQGRFHRPARVRNTNSVKALPTSQRKSLAPMLQPRATAAVSHTGRANIDSTAMSSTSSPITRATRRRKLRIASQLGSSR